MKTYVMKQLYILLLFTTSCVIFSFDIPEDSQEIECELVLRNMFRSGESVYAFSHPRIPYVFNNTSTNWAGYVAVSNLSKPASHVVNNASGTWIVPKLAASVNHTYCAMWVGIDGYTSGSVEQIGSLHEWVNGKQQNSVWFEMYPLSSFGINNFPLRIGDSITASVEYIGKNVFKLVILNNTAKVHYMVPTSATTSATAQRSSAEWILEAPYLNGILPLANFGRAHFFNCQVTINGMKGAINTSKWAHNGLLMVNAQGRIKAAISGLANLGKDFIVDWHQ